MILRVAFAESAAAGKAAFEVGGSSQAANEITALLHELMEFAPRMPLRSPDAWVQSEVEKEEPTKRLTLDIPKSLHGRFKAACALKDETMLDVVLKFLEDKYPES